MTITEAERLPGSGRAVPTVRRPHRRLPSHLAFAGSAAAFAALYVAAGAPTPLLVVFEQHWHFPTWVLTVAFAAYAIGLLAALLAAGSLSDHLGRRPILIGCYHIENWMTALDQLNS